jgi:hypothetical protein
LFWTHDPDSGKATAMRKAHLFLLSCFLVLSIQACDKGLAWGDHNAVIVVAPEAWWPELQDSVYTILSPTVVTVREERTFRITLQDPTEPNWGRLRLFREEVVIGSPGQPWVDEVLATLDEEIDPQPGDVFETEDVWARNQNVTILIVDQAASLPEQVFPRLATVHDLLEQRFLREAQQRMFTSGRDSVLADSLQHLAGFSLLLPQVYRWGREDSTYVFRNDNPDPSELIRQFGVSWRFPAPDALPVDSLLDWRRAVAQEFYAYPQVVDREAMRVSTVAARNGTEMLEIRGTWKNPPGTSWPAAGPFILRGVQCPQQGRLYLVDAWLYAPGKDKWEYMLQLETILGSFRCGDSSPLD